MSLSAALFLSPTVNRLANLTPALPRLRMLLSHAEYSADGRRVRGFVQACAIEGTGGVAECPLHAAPPVPRSPAGAAPSDMRGMVVSVALRLSARNKRCTLVCAAAARTVRSSVRRVDGGWPARSDEARPRASARCGRGALR